ncbi:phosphopantetheine--protein transferase-like protein [Anaerosolibacter carboniphilus]|uniref:Holo-[acyl-carrier-protein] synthase n=1 Tax=Anaerosolibacter carboniphilus TaxID=1417629 RepID=A0A841KZK8_9FIRM|nr:holo-ACP synthase [Anaerosolibacter carboniphilus]MBB6218797.1 phosphopantetheine--protein transferase-like protein [Anaerosolibacter carboniphilus]
MIKGIGIDIIEIERIVQAINRNNKFLERIFTDKEIAYFKSANGSQSSIAGNFAAKEAVVKAIGTGIRGFKWRDIEVERDSLGKPSIQLYNQARDIVGERGIDEILITISHSRDYAVAQAIAIGKE